MQSCAFLCKCCSVQLIFFFLKSVFSRRYFKNDPSVCVFPRSLKGVPLAYDNIRILGQYGDIIGDSGYVHMDILADFIVFQPRKGQKLLVRLAVLSPTSLLLWYCWGHLEPSPWKRVEAQKYVCQINRCCATFTTCKMRTWPEP